jgi:hypothetical protein
VSTPLDEIEISGVVYPIQSVTPDRRVLVAGAAERILDPATPHGRRVVASLVVLEGLLGSEAFTELADRLDDEEDSLNTAALVDAARRLSSSAPQNHPYPQPPTTS